MGICWYCHWGWPKQVADLYDEYLDLAGHSAMHYGPAHIVWEDENFGTAAIESCIARCGENDTLIRESLEKLLAVPEEIRCCEPDDYDDEHPDKFPPPKELMMVKR